MKGRSQAVLSKMKKWPKIQQKMVKNNRTYFPKEKPFIVLYLQHGIQVTSFPRV